MIVWHFRRSGGWSQINIYQSSQSLADYIFDQRFIDFYCELRMELGCPCFKLCLRYRLAVSSVQRICDCAYIAAGDNPSKGAVG